MNILPENLYVTNLKEIYASINSYLYLGYHQHFVQK
jgi:hypothetical protein